MASTSTSTSTPAVVVEVKRRKGVALLAAGAGAAVLLGGSSFALWHATSEGSVPEITTGYVTLSTDYVDAWHHDTVDGDYVSYVVPEDTVVGTITLGLNGVGDNLKVALTNPTILQSDVTEDKGFEVDVAYTVDGEDYALGDTIDLRGVGTAKEIVATVTVTFDDEATATAATFAGLMNSVFGAGEDGNFGFRVDQVVE